MKRFLTLLAGATLMASMTVAAFAQAAGPTGGGVQQTTGGAQAPGKARKAHAPVPMKLLKELNLSKDQKGQIKALVQKMQAQQKEQPVATGKPNRKEAMAKREAFLLELGKILTTEQKDKLKTLMEQAKKNGKAGKGTPPPPPAGAKTGGG